MALRLRRTEEASLLRDEERRDRAREVRREAKELRQRNRDLEARYAASLAAGAWRPAVGIGADAAGPPDVAPLASPGAIGKSPPWASGSAGALSHSSSTGSGSSDLDDSDGDESTGSPSPEGRRRRRK